ncbi:T9SS type A sorting domain-containing protein [Ekhidna sp.]|uniref:T9SS type A sorting domain-containing protein n=1 Tax=Ekhidna sp. TaxID=2608089 RepID=UPI003BA8739A
MIDIKSTIGALLMFFISTFALSQSIELVDQETINSYSGTSYEVINSLTIGQGFNHSVGNGNFFARITDNFYYPLSPVIASRNVKIEVVLSENSDPNTIQSGIEVRTTTGDLIAGIWVPDGRRLEFNPDEPLPANTTFEVKSNTSLLSNSGVPFGLFQFQFNTMSDVDGVTTLNRTNSSGEIEWNPVAGASYYNVVLAGDPDFNTIISDATIAETTISFSNLEEGSAYFVRVAPGNETGTSVSTVYGIYTITEATTNVSYVNYKYENNLSWPLPQNSGYTYKVKIKRSDGSILTNAFQTSNQKFHYGGPAKFYLSVSLNVPNGGLFPIIENQPYHSFIRPPYNIEIDNFTNTYELEWDQSPGDSTYLEIKDFYGNNMGSTYALGRSYTLDGPPGQVQRIDLKTVADGGMSEFVAFSTYGTVFARPSKPSTPISVGYSNNIKLDFIIPDETVHNLNAVSEILEIFVRTSTGGPPIETKSISSSSYNANDVVSVTFFPLSAGTYFVDARFKGSKNDLFPMKGTQGLPGNQYNYITDFSDEIQVTVGVFGDQVETEVVLSSEDEIKDLKIYPNPTSESLNIELPEIASSDTNWLIYDLSGKVVMTGKLEAESIVKTLKVKDLPSGVYVFAVSVEEKTLLNERFVIEH